MIFIKKLTISVVLISFFTTTYAQQLTLSNAIKLSKEQNLRIQSHKKRSKASEHNYKAEKSNYLPTVSLVGGYTHLSEELKIDLSTVQTSFVDGLSRQQVATLDIVNQKVFDTPLTDVQKKSIYDNSYTVLNELYPDFDARISHQDFFLAAVTLQQPIYLGGKLKGLHSIAASQYTISQQVYQQTSDLVIQRSIIQYFTIVLFEEVVNARKASVKAMQKHAYNTSKLVENEIIPAYYELGAKAALSGTETRLALASNNLHTAQINYNNLLNIPQDTILVLTSKLKYLDLAIEEKNTTEKSLSYSPLLKINAENMHIASQNTSISKSGYLPNIFAVGEYQLYQQNLPVITPPWMAGVHMKWDLFSGNRHINRTRAAKVLEQEVEINNKLISSDIKLAVQNSYNNAQNARTIYDNETKTLDLTVASHKAIQKQYTHGLAKSSEVIDSQLLVEEAHLAKLTALFAYYISLVELYKLRGEINEFVTLYEATN